jgi:hypothetical protein
VRESSHGHALAVDGGYTARIEAVALAWPARPTAMPARPRSELGPEPETPHIRDETRMTTRLEAEAARITPGGPDGTIQQAEEAGLVFAFQARCLAIQIVALSIVVLVPWPRNLYYLGFVAGSSCSVTCRSGCDDTDLRR